MFSFIRTQIDQLVSFLRPLSISRNDSGKTSSCGLQRRSYCSRSNTLIQHIKTPCIRKGSAPRRSTIREKRLSAKMANATTGRERAVSFGSREERNPLIAFSDHHHNPNRRRIPCNRPEDPMSVIASSDDEELLDWISPNDSPRQKDRLPVSSER